MPVSRRQSRASVSSCRSSLTDLSRSRSRRPTANRSPRRGAADIKRREKYRKALNMKRRRVLRSRARDIVTGRFIKATRNRSSASSRRQPATRAPDKRVQSVAASKTSGSAKTTPRRKSVARRTSASTKKAPSRRGPAMRTRAAAARR